MCVCVFKWSENIEGKIIAKGKNRIKYKKKKTVPTYLYKSYKEKQRMEKLEITQDIVREQTVDFGQAFRESV